MEAAQSASASSPAAQDSGSTSAVETPIPFDPSHTVEGVAPPQLFASPFLSEHERAIVTMMHADHPTLSQAQRRQHSPLMQATLPDHAGMRSITTKELTRSTLTILQRLSDRLAHYLIHRAHRGLNAGMQIKLETVLCGSEQTLEGPECDRHSILFAFDEPVWSAVGSLRKFAHSAWIKAQTKLEDIRAGGAEPVIGRTKHFMLSLAVADRWLRDFTLGLRLTDPDASLPSHLHSVEQRVALCATVEYVLEELLELAGGEANEQDETTVQPAHLWRAMENDEEMRALCTFLPVNWTMQTDGIVSSTQLACASQPFDSAHHHSRILQRKLSPHIAAQAELNRSSWYHDPAAVIDAARMAARGQLAESLLSRQLREAHVRPMRFWGVADSLDSSLRRACVVACGFDYGQLYEFTREHAFVSFELSDASGRAFQMLLVGQRDGAPRGLCFVSLPGSAFELCLAAFMRVDEDQRVVWSAATGTRADDAPMALDEYRARGEPAARAPAEGNSEAAATQQDNVLAASSDATIAATVTAASASSADAPVAASAGSSAVEATTDRLPARTLAEIECACRAATPLLKFSLLGPTVFAENHPPQMRRLFTAHLIDCCMLESGLRPLPLVLSELISEFHSFDLPFRQDKATEQMSQAGLQPRTQEPAKATYEGQLDSTVERVCDAELEVDRRFPVTPAESSAEAEGPQQ